MTRLQRLRLRLFDKKLVETLAKKLKAMDTKTLDTLRAMN